MIAGRTEPCRRNRRRAVAGSAGALTLATIVLVVGAVSDRRAHPPDVEARAPTPSTRTSRPAARATTIDPSYFRLVGPGQAWIASSDPRIGVWHTNDAGRTWTDATPPLPPSRRTNNVISGFVATDDAHAIVAVPLGANSVRVTLYETGDGGTSWSASTIAGYDAQRFSFLDANVGWDESSRGAAAGSEAVDVWRTVDGGAHWERMSRGDGLAGQAGTPGALSSGCDKSGLAFTDRDTGFATGVCGSGFLFFMVTHDAGRTWAPGSLPRPPGVSAADVQAQRFQQFAQPPVFDGPEGAGTLDGVRVTGHRFSHHPYVYSTTDGGAHWTLADPPLPNAKWVVVADPTHWWAGSGTHLLTTADAGAHWSSIRSNLALELGNALEFASPTDAWALAGSRSGARRVVQTLDGGGTWSPVPSPRRAP